MAETITDKPAYMQHMPYFVNPLAPIVIDHARGSWVYGTDGSKWLDFVVGIAVVNTGHCHPKVVAAVQEQAAKVSHAQMGIYRHRPCWSSARSSWTSCPRAWTTCMYANSGAEAVENAVKLAKQATRRPGIIAFQGAFHGRTHLTMALTDSVVHYRGHMEPLAGGIYHARYCYPYRTPASEDPTAYAIETCAACCAPRSCATTWPPSWSSPSRARAASWCRPAEFMRELRGIADEIGAMLIIDEIQAGMGRTGTWFCHEHYDVTPDIITFAKGIASGYPLAGIAARQELWDKCMPGSMGGTYGGNPVACAAACATIDAMREDDMLANAARQGDKLMAFFPTSRPSTPASARCAARAS